MSKINEKECPNCGSTNTKLYDTTYNCETHECLSCNRHYEVRFKPKAIAVKLIPLIRQD